MKHSNEFWGAVSWALRPRRVVPGGRRTLSVNTAINRSLRKGKGPREAQEARRGPARDRDEESTKQQHNFSLRFSDGRGEPSGKGIPVTIPYTTAASEFVYGTSAVKAALQTRRRKCYKLYIYSGEQREDENEDVAIRKMALQKGVMVQRIKGSDIRLMDKMSAGRPHNGLILDASPLPRVPIVSLGAVQQPTNTIPLEVDHQSREEEQVNGKPTFLHYDASARRYPFVVLLDGILDSGNLGAIIRSAFFLGVDAVITAGNTAPLSPVALKASAGAAEHMPLLTTRQPYDFVEKCKANGWQIYAADATQDLGRHFPKLMPASKLVGPLLEHPCVLILGGEGEGIRRRLLEKANSRVMISGSRLGQGGVDSLNVSVAAGILFDVFLGQSGSRASESLRKKAIEAKKDRLF